MFYISQRCPVCAVGHVGFCRCADSTTIALMCSCCDSQWEEPAVVDAVHAVFPPDDGGACPVWASQSEVELKGWLNYVVGELVTT